ncbi:hypothetical protein, partial [Actinoplanes xinjiangensis]|uniref:hypothetical protein n=1 Tax=Actinoplanes xinjiangensis TaxID=512350 RepID=UPI003418BD44
ELSRVWLGHSNILPACLHGKPSQMSPIGAADPGLLGWLSPLSPDVRDSGVNQPGLLGWLSPLSSDVRDSGVNQLELLGWLSPVSGGA